MRIVRARGPEAAAELEGCVVVIDVLRAFTTAAFAFARGARSIVLVGTAGEAFALRATRDVVLVGESDGRKLAGFDHGNSPEEIDALDLRGRDVVLRSTAGTQGVVRAELAESIVLGSLVVAAATVRALRGEAHVSLLAMGSPLGADELEDDVCADLLEDRLLGRDVDLSRVRERALASPAAARAHDPRVGWITPGDVERALEIDRFDFVMRVRRENGGFVARAEPM